VEQDLLTFLDAWVHPWFVLRFVVFISSVVYWLFFYLSLFYFLLTFSVFFDLRLLITPCGTLQSSCVPTLWPNMELIVQHNNSKFLSSGLWSSGKKLGHIFIMMTFLELLQIWFLIYFSIWMILYLLVPSQWTVGTQRWHLSINIHRSKTENNIAMVFREETTHWVCTISIAYLSVNYTSKRPIRSN
jgi:hypothetical protein